MGQRTIWIFGNQYKIERFTIGTFNYNSSLPIYKLTNIWLIIRYQATCTVVYQKEYASVGGKFFRQDITQIGKCFKLGSLVHLQLFSDDFSLKYNPKPRKSFAVLWVVNFWNFTKFPHINRHRVPKFKFYMVWNI